MKIINFFKQARSGGILWLILFAVIAGLLLLFFSGFMSTDNEISDTSDVGVGISVTEHELMLEDKITRLCEKVNGVSDVTVVVSLDGGFEYVYARDGSENYVLIGSGNSENGVFLGERSPKISGVGIVCRGGDDSGIQQELISLVSAACGIGTNKIFITGSQ